LANDIFVLLTIYGNDGREHNDNNRLMRILFLTEFTTRFSFFPDRDPPETTVYHKEESIVETT